MKVSELVKSFKGKNIEDIVDEKMPVDIFSQHYKKNDNSGLNYGIAYTFLTLFYVLLKELYLHIKYALIGAQISESCIKTLFYIPNIKYERFFNSLEDEIEDSYFIITNGKITREHQCLKHIKNKSTFVFFIKSYIFIFSRAILIVFFERNRMKKFNIKIPKLFKLFNLISIYNFLFKKIKFTQFFSFAPSTDQHQILYHYYREEFRDFYSIRPEATSYVDEIKTIQSNILFYKSNYEKNIYKHYKLQDKMKLIKGGALAKPNININNCSDDIVFFDTAKSKNTNINIARKKFVEDLIDILLASKQDRICYYKFHPATARDDKNQIIVKTGKTNRIKFVDDINTIYFKHAISFYSTVIQDVILSGKNIFLIHQYYSIENLNNRNMENEYQDSPLKVIRNKTDLINSLVMMADDSQMLYLNNKINKWYKSFINYPVGLNNILKHINC